MTQLLKRFVREEEGLETIEYAVMTALIVTGLVAVLTTLGGNIQQLFTDISNELPAAQ